METLHWITVETSLDSNIYQEKQPCITSSIGVICWISHPTGSRQFSLLALTTPPVFLSVGSPLSGLCVLPLPFLSAFASPLFGASVVFSLSFLCPTSPPSNPPSTYAEVPQLTDLSFKDVSDTSISLHWSPLNTTAITGYRVTVVAAGESVPIFEDMVLPTTGHYTVYGLEPGINYDISVITVTENGESEPTTLTQQTCKIHVSINQKGFFYYK